MSGSLKRTLQSSKRVEGLGHGPGSASADALISLRLDLPLMDLSVVGSPKGSKRESFMDSHEGGPGTSKLVMVGPPKGHVLGPAAAS